MRSEEGVEAIVIVNSKCMWWYREGWSSGKTYMKSLTAVLALSMMFLF